MPNSTTLQQRGWLLLLFFALVCFGPVWGQTCQTPTNTRTNTVLTTSANVSWTPSGTRLGFTIRYRPLSNTIWTTATTSSSIYNIVGLINGVIYEWQVQQVCEDLSTSAFTSSTTFTTGCSAPGSLQTSSIGPVSAQVFWQYMGNDITYVLQWRQQGSATWTTVNTTNTSYTIPNLTPSTAYEWQIQTDCGSGLVSTLSPLQSFTTQACSVPTSLLTSTPAANQIDLYWNGPGGTGIIYDLQYRPRGGNWITLPNLPNASQFISGLIANTAYEFQVRSNCGSSGSSAYSAPRSFTTAICPASVGSPTNPFSSGVYASRANLNWSRPNSTISTELQYRQQGSTTPWTSLTGLSTSLALTGLTPVTPYEWQVRAVCSGSVFSAWTSLQSFTTTGCTVPTSLGSSSGSPDRRPVFWSGPFGADYNLQYRQQGSTSWISVNGLTTTSYSITGLTPSTPYQWQVQSVCSTSVTSAFSNTATFTTVACLAPASLSSDQVLPTSARLFWNSNSNRFNLQWREGSSNPWTTVSGLTSSPYSLTGLSNGTVYQFQVQAVCTTSQNSSYSSPVSFTTGCRAPTSPNRSTAFTTSHQINWPTTYSGTPATYTVQYRPQVPVDGVWTSLSGLSTNTILVNNLNPSTAYQFQVQANCPGGVSSTFTSPPTGFTTLGCTTNSANNFSTSNVTYRSARVRWFGNSNDQFVLLYRPTSTTAWVSVGLLPADYASNGLIINNLNPSTAYQWQVATYCTPTQSTAGAAIQSFTTTGCVSPVASSNNMSSSTSFDRANLSWSSGQSGDVFRVQYRPVGGTFIVLPDQTDNFLSLTGLATNVTFEWQVALVCSASLLSPFTSSTFATVCQNQATNLSRTNNFNSAQLSWSGNWNDSYDVFYRTQGGQWITAASNLSASFSSFSFSLTGLVGETVYEWGVAFKCSPTASSTITLGPSFTTACLNTFTPTMLGTFNVTPTSAQLNYFNFNNSGGSYDIRYRIVGAANWILLGNQTNSFLNLTGLTSNATYEWQAAIRCSATVSSSFTPSQTFVTECRVPTNPGTFNITFNGATLGWNGSLGVTYELDYQQQGASNWTTVTTTNTFLSLTGVSGAINWRVRTNCGNGVTSAYAPTQSFTTVCNNPSFISTAGVSSYGARIVWGDIGTGARYTLQWRQGAGSWNTIPNITRTEYVLTNLSNGAGYQVQVQGVCGTQTSANFTNPLSFVASCPQPSGLGLLSSGTTGTSRQFSWNNVFGVSYQVQWRLQGAQSWNTSPVLNEISQTSNSAFYNLNDLSAGAYEWQVRTVCADGLTTNYTAGQSFTVGACNTAPPQFHNSSPAFRTAFLSWSGGGVAPYELRWRPQGSSVWNLATNFNNSNLSLDGLQGNTAYEWQVRVVCPNSQTTAFGPLQTFTTTCGQATNPGVCASSRGAQLFWSGPTEATYDINWRLLGASTWTSITGVTRPFSLTGLSNNTAYEWQVRTVCSPTVATTFTAPVSFTTQCVPPGFLSVSLLTCSGGVLLWSVCSNAGDTYVVRYRAVNTSNWITLNSTNTSISVSGLTPRTAYEFQVQTDCGGGNLTGFSNSFNFTTPGCEPPCTPATLPFNFNAWQFDITNNAASLNYSGTFPYELRWRQGGATTWNTNTTNTFRLTGLADATTYDWQVRSTCSDPDDFTPISFFRTVCNIPFDPVANDIRPESARLLWNGFSGDTRYEIRYRTGNGAWTTITTGNNASSQTLSGLTNNTPYEWQIRTLCVGGGSSGWSHSLFFTTLCPAPASLFSDRIDLTTVRCNWSQTVFGVSYTLQYRQQGSTTWTTVGGLTSNNSLLTYAITGLSEQTTYEWQVLTDCGNGNSSATTNQPLTFRTLGTAPPCNAMVTIQNGDWTNPAIWSCNRVPMATDPVQIRHNVMIPDNGTGRALRVSYDAGGQLRFGTAARLLLGQ